MCYMREEALRVCIASLKRTVGEQADQIEGLAVELEWANGLIDKAITTLREYINPSETGRFHLTDKERQWVERSVLWLILLGKNRNSERQQRRQAEAREAALRQALDECAAWLESRPDYTEGDAATSSMARGVLAAIPSAVATGEDVKS